MDVLTLPELPPITSPIFTQVPMMDSFTPPQMQTMTSPASQLPMPTMTSPAMTGGARPMGPAMGGGFGGGQAQRCPTCGK